MHHRCSALNAIASQGPFCTSHVARLGTKHRRMHLRLACHRSKYEIGHKRLTDSRTCLVAIPSGENWVVGRPYAGATIFSVLNQGGTIERDTSQRVMSRKSFLTQVDSSP